MATAVVAVAGTTVVADTPPLNRYLVSFWGHDLEGPGAQATDYNGARIVDRMPALRMIVVEPANPVLFLALTHLDEDVRYVLWDDPRAAHLDLVPNDARYNDAGHYGSKIIGAEAAWDRTLGTTAVKVAMIDSGLNKNHEEFAGSGRVLPGWDYYNNDPDPDDTSGCSWHGTHTSGTAGATLNNGVGIAGLSQHTILPLKAFQPTFGCGGSTTALVNALQAAGDNGAHLSSNSWSSSAANSAFNDAITYSHNLGTIHVASAGNSGPCSNCVSFPWRDMSAVVIIVASSTSSDTKSSFSSEGPQVDLIAPGSSILSSTSSPAGYGLLSGTSMAAPHVTGTAALMKALNPGWTFADIEGTLKSTAVDLGLSANQQGAGRLNADGATGGGSPPPPPPPPSESVHTHDIDSARKGKTPRFTVWAFDNAETAEAGVTVSVETCKSGGGCATGTASTGSDGSVTFQWKNAGAGTYTTCVTGMAKTGFTWDQAAGHASSGNCHTQAV